MESDGRGKRPRGAGSNRAGDASGSGSGSEQLAIDATAAKPQEEVISDAAEPDLAVVIRGGARRFLVNRSVLALCSLTLRSMMQDCRLPMSASGDYEELRLDDNESPSLRLFLRLMYPRDVGLMGDDQTILDMEVSHASRVSALFFMTRLLSYWFCTPPLPLCHPDRVISPQSSAWQTSTTHQASL